MDVIKATGKMQIHEQTDTEKAAWIAKLMPVHKEMEKPLRQGFHRPGLQSLGLRPAPVLKPLDPFP